MLDLYRDRYSNPTANAQANLAGRTHYVDPGTLRFHKSRILSTRVTDGGLLLAILESVALDMDNTKRGFRYVVFDIFGAVISRVELEDCFKTREQARKAMWVYLDKCDAKAITLNAIARAERRVALEIDELRAFVGNIAAAA